MIVQRAAVGFTFHTYGVFPELAAATCSKHCSPSSRRGQHIKEVVISINSPRLIDILARMAIYAEEHQAESMGEGIHTSSSMRVVIVSDEADDVEGTRESKAA